jgi:drug/metabolite transporter (DMT)-like permease
LSITPSLPSLAALAANAFLTTALGFIIYFHLLRTVGGVRTASVGYLKPATGVVIGCMLLDELLTYQIVLGLAAILIGLAAINRSGARFSGVPATRSA